MPTITTPIVGAHFRPPARQVLSILPLSTPLILEPEPDNPYDPSAIKVLVSLRSTYPIAKWVQLDEALDGTGYTGHSLLRSEETEGPLHLGYIPKSGSKTCQGGPGNLELATALAAEGSSFTARLGASPEGYPTCIVEVSQND